MECVKLLSFQDHALEYCVKLLTFKDQASEYCSADFYRPSLRILRKAVDLWKPGTLSGQCSSIHFSCSILRTISFVIMHKTADFYSPGLEYCVKLLTFTKLDFIYCVNLRTFTNQASEYYVKKWLIFQDPASEYCVKLWTFRDPACKLLQTRP